MYSYVTKSYFQERTFCKHFFQDEFFFFLYEISEHESTLHGNADLWYLIKVYNNIGTSNVYNLILFIYIIPIYY